MDIYKITNQTKTKYFQKWFMLTMNNGNKSIGG